MNGFRTQLRCAALAIGIAACGRADPSADVDSAGDVEVARPTLTVDSFTSRYVVSEVFDGGTIRGTVRYRGEVPQTHTVSVTEDSEVCGATQLVQSVVVGSRGGLADAVISLIDISSGAELTLQLPPTLDQRGCAFTPHVLLAPVGIDIQILNSDPLTHNVHTAAFDNRSVNRSQPVGLEVIELRFDTPEKVKVKCDLHPWMGAWIVVIDHPYHSVTNDTGTFELLDVPPGEYTLEAWHETLGTRRQVVTVLAGGVQEIDIDLAMGD